MHLARDSETHWMLVIAPGVTVNIKGESDMATTRVTSNAHQAQKPRIQYSLSLEKVCGKSVKYSNSDGVNFYAPKPVTGSVGDPPATITLTVTAEP